MFKLQRLLTLALCLGTGLTGLTSAASSAAEVLRITSGFQPSADLSSWELPELKKEKRASSREKDPQTGKVVPFEGVLLSGLVEKSLAKLPAEQRASVDLLVLRNRNGQESHMPRSLLQKYPLLVAFAKDQGFDMVIPWTSRPRIQAEGYPLERYFVRNLASIELSSYESKYRPLFLSRRSDPAAVRGERIFVQNCMGCHNGGEPRSPASGIGKANQVPKAHPSVPGFAALPDRDKRALGSYFEAFRLEHPQSQAAAATATSGAQTR